MRTWGTWSHWVCGQEGAERDGCWYSAPFPLQLCSSETQPMGWQCPQREPLEDLHMYRDGWSFLGDSAAAKMTGGLNSTFHLEAVSHFPQSPGYKIATHCFNVSCRVITKLSNVFCLY